MDGHHFDALTRALATRDTRRAVVTGLAGLVAGLATGRTTAAACPPEQVNRRRMGCVCKTTGRPPDAATGWCPCPSGLTRCDGVCVDPAQDVAHCGDCGFSCDDGNACTVDVCRNGRCQHEAIVCDDGLDCTNDRCDPTVGCVHEPDHAACDDGVACTIDLCDPRDPARDDRGCVHRPDAGACDKGIVCITHACDPVGGCLDFLNDDRCPQPANPCRRSVCTLTGCVEVDDLEAACEIPDDRCVLSARCGAGGVCQPEEVVDCSGAGGECVAAACNPVDGSCVQDAAAMNGTSCVGSDQCLVERTCLDGVCAGGVARDCRHLDGVCTQGVCDDFFGCQPRVLTGQVCEDNNPCTVLSRCRVDGTCGDGVRITCPNPPECYQNGVCVDPSDTFPGGCVYDRPSPAGTPCQINYGLCDGSGQCELFPCPPGYVEINGGCFKTVNSTLNNCDFGGCDSCGSGGNCAGVIYETEDIVVCFRGTAGECPNGLDSECPSGTACQTFYKLCLRPCG